MWLWNQHYLDSYLLFLYILYITKQAVWNWMVERNYIFLFCFVFFCVFFFVWWLLLLRARCIYLCLFFCWCCVYVSFIFNKIKILITSFSSIFKIHKISTLRKSVFLVYTYMMYPSTDTDVTEICIFTDNSEEWIKNIETPKNVVLICLMMMVWNVYNLTFTFYIARHALILIVAIMLCFCVFFNII